MLKRDSSLFHKVLEPGANSADRRLSPRYPAVQNRAYLGWREDGAMREQAGRLLNVSNTGLLIATEAPPGAKEPVWVRLEGPTPTDWIATTIVRVDKITVGFLWSRKPSYQIRLSFNESCPYEFFKSATHGNQLDATEAAPTLPEHDNRYWR